jgi:transcriptional regulator with XRE-family HTH domain
MDICYDSVVKHDTTSKKGGNRMVNLAKLRGLMAERGLEVNKLAGILGISRQATSDKLNGKSKISLTDAQAISKALEMTNEERDLIFFNENVKSEATR